VQAPEHRLLVVIPVYNHYKKITAIIEKINSFNLPCLLLDDGSDDITQHTLQDAIKAKLELQNTTAKNILIRNPINRGKGAVVCEGILYAQQHHYTHVLQVDADGQHDLNDIPEFLEASRLHPDAVISGYRSYDAMPAGRRYGRMVTDIWVTINTLSRNIKDSMCGYRLYPVNASAELIKQSPIGARMDFDTDIIVRLYWRGLEVQHINTRIIYSDHIDSHFDMWADNLRISRMHARLFFGMLIRLPKLLMWNLLLSGRYKYGHACTTVQQDALNR